MLMPTIYRYMTADPRTIAASATMAEAHELMRVHGFRHVPAIEGGKLIGVLSDRDLRLVESVRDEPLDRLTVAEAMSRSVLTVAPETPLDEVIELMAAQRCDVVIVVGKTRVVGIFTAIDAYCALVHVLQREAA